MRQAQSRSGRAEDQAAAQEPKSKQTKQRQRTTLCSRAADARSCALTSALHSVAFIGGSRGSARRKKEPHIQMVSQGFSSLNQAIQTRTRLIGRATGRSATSTEEAGNGIN